MQREHFNIKRFLKYSITPLTCNAWLLDGGLVLMQMHGVASWYFNLDIVQIATCNYMILDLKIQKIQNCEHIQVSAGGSDKRGPTLCCHTWSDS